MLGLLLSNSRDLWWQQCSSLYKVTMSSHVTFVTCKNGHHSVIFNQWNGLHENPRPIRSREILIQRCRPYLVTWTLNSNRRDAKSVRWSQSWKLLSTFSFVAFEQYCEFARVQNYALCGLTTQSSLFPPNLYAILTIHTISTTWYTFRDRKILDLYFSNLFLVKPPPWFSFWLVH